MGNGTIVIDPNCCKGCELCTTVCPPKLIEMAGASLNSKGYHPAIFHDPEGRCTGCTACALICPDICITVYHIQLAEMGSLIGQGAGRS